MKAVIDSDGMLCLTPETPLEQYALNKWADDRDKQQEVWGNLRISTEEVV